MTKASDNNNQPEKSISNSGQEQRNQIDPLILKAQKDEALEKIAKGLAHNINNLLTGVLGNINIAITKANDDTKKYLVNARESAIRASELIENLISITNDNNKIKQTSISINDLLLDVVNTIKNCDSDKITIETNFQKDLPPVMLDRELIHTAFTHIILNAKDAILHLIEKIDHFPNRQHDSFYIKIETSYSTKSHPSKPNDKNKQYTYNLISFDDNGIGINKEIQGQIFDPFFTTKKTVGNGLGLAGAEKIIQNHNGWIDFESQYGIGSKFKVYLPIE